MEVAFLYLGLLVLGLYVILWLAPLVLGLYFVPSLLASARLEHPRGVYVLNLLLGWTVLGWLIALTWAMTGAPRDGAAPPTHAPRPGGGPRLRLIRGHRRRWTPPPGTKSAER